MNKTTSNITAVIVTLTLLLSVFVTAPQVSQAQALTDQESSISDRDTLILQIITILNEIIIRLSKTENKITEEETTVVIEIEETQENEEITEESDANQNSVSTSAELKVNSNSATDDDEGMFKIEFPITAFGNDLYINRSSERGTAEGVAGVNYVIEDGSGSIVTTGLAQAALTSGAKREANQFKVPEGTSETFVLSVTFDPVDEDFYRLQLHSINFATNPGNPKQFQIARPEERYETDLLSI